MHGGAVNGVTRVLVTGGAGFIGSHLVRILLARGHRVTVLDNLLMGKRDNVPAGAGFVLGDVRDRACVEDLVGRHDAVAHLAAVVSIRASLDRFMEDADTNLMGTLNLLHCLPRSGIRKFVLASSMAVYADAASPEPVPESHETAPISPYGISKLAAEKYALLVCGLKKVPCVVLRYFNTLGPGQAFTPYVGVITIFIRRLLEGKRPVVFGDGGQKRDFVHVQDVARATALALDAPIDGAILNVGTGIATSVNEVAAALIGKLQPGTAPEYAPTVPGELRYSVADIERARRLLGYAPTRTLAEGLDEVIAFHRGT